jgi:hypothetical protein
LGIHTEEQLEEAAAEYKRELEHGCDHGSTEGDVRAKPGTELAYKNEPLPVALEQLANGTAPTRHGELNVGMGRWTSDYLRERWNESEPRISSPLFVPKVLLLRTPNP